jgi:DnaJ domain
MAEEVEDIDAILVLLAPDGYYKYLGVAKAAYLSEGTVTPPSQPTTSNPPPPIDEDRIKKAYRKLSRKHHPDKPGGDADTFRLLNRAQKVLLNPKLRQQYDVLGIDLDDDEAHEGDEDGHATDEKDGQPRNPNTAQGIVQEIASTVLSSLVQLGVRTREYSVVLRLCTHYWVL